MSLELLIILIKNMVLALHEVKTMFRKKKMVVNVYGFETKGSIEHGACKTCKILRKGMDFFRVLYLLLLCRHFSVRQDIILLCATESCRNPSRSLFLLSNKIR